MAIQKLIAREKPFISFKNTHNKLICSTLFSTRQSSDVFQRNNKTSFKKTEGPSQKTIDYINQVRTELEAEKQKLSSLLQLDPSKIEDIAAGIKVFEGWSSYDLYLLTINFDALLLQRGCSHQCSHCGANSPPKIINMNWDNFKAIVEGMGELKNRLGFNSFTTSFKYFLYPFHDSDPMIFRSQTIDPVSQKVIYKDIYDAAELFYKHTSSKFFITTAGWNNDISQNAALKIANNYNTIKGASYSISQSHNLLETSKEYSKQAELETNTNIKNDLFNKANKMKQRYINMAANNLLTLWPLVENNKLSIILLFDKDDTNNNGKDEADNLAQSIYENMQTIMSTQKNGIGPKSYQDIKKIITHRAISYIGRGSKLSDDKEAKEKNEERKKYYSTVIQDQNFKKIQLNPTYIDTNGDIIVNLLPEKDRKAGTVLFYPVRIANKKLNLPVKVPDHKIYQSIDKLVWPPLSYLKTYFSYLCD